MPKLPALTAKQVLRALRRLGFFQIRQKGAHAIFQHPESKRMTVVPIHAGKTIKNPCLKVLLKMILE